MTKQRHKAPRTVDRLQVGLAQTSDTLLSLVNKRLYQGMLYVRLGNNGLEVLQEQTCLRLRVVRSHKVWSVFLLEALAAALRKVFVVMENATSGIRRQVDAALVTQVSQVEHTQHIDPNDLQLQHQTRKVRNWKPGFTVKFEARLEFYLVIFTPVNIGASSQTSSI